MKVNHAHVGVASGLSTPLHLKQTWKISPRSLVTVWRKMVTVIVPRTGRSVIISFCKYKLNPLCSLRFSSRKLVKTNVVCIGIITKHYGTTLARISSFCSLEYERPNFDFRHPLHCLSTYTKVSKL